MVADTYSSLLGWLDQGTGNNNNTWGDNCDISVFTVLEKGITGFVTRAVTGGTTDLSASPPPAGPTAALEYIQQFTGTLVADHTVTVPNLAKTWLVYNSCTLGAFNLKFKTPAGSAVNIPLGWQIVWCDGSNVIRIGLGTVSATSSGLVPTARWRRRPGRSPTKLAWAFVALVLAISGERSAVSTSGR
jgi:hypothetical protein